jgi:hypothetical protein
MKAFMMTACTFGYLRSRTSVLETGLVFPAYFQYVGSVVILYRLDFSPRELSDRTTVGGLRVVEGRVPGKIATRVTSMVTFGQSTGRSPHTFGLFQHAKRNMLHQPIA